MHLRQIFLLLILQSFLHGQYSDSTLTPPQFYNAFSLSSDQLAELPVRDYQDILSLYSGLVHQDGQTHLRGSRPDEIGYYLNDVSVRDPLTGGNSLYIIPEAMERISIMPGSTPIELTMGNAGAIQIRFRQGTDNTHFSVKIRSDKFASIGEKQFDTYSYRDQIITGVLSGTLYNKLKYFVAVENKEIGDTQKRFTNGYNFENQSVNSFPGDPDTLKTITYPDGFTPGNSLKQWAVNSNLLYKNNNNTLQLNTAYLTKKTYSDDTPMLNVLNKRDLHEKVNELFLSGSLDHQFDVKTSLDLSLYYFSRNTEIFDKYLGNDWRSWSDSSKIAQYTGGQIIYHDTWNPEQDYQINGFPFSRDGSLLNDYSKSKQHRFGISLKYINKITDTHTLEIGADYNQYKFREFNIDPAVMVYENQPDIPDYLWAEYTENFYGYDLQGNKTDRGLDGAKTPYFINGFIEDTYKFNNIAFQAGLVVSSFYTDDRNLKNPAWPRIDRETQLIKKDEWKRKKPNVNYQPRINFIFDSTRNFTVKFSYGKYSQPAKLNYIYYNQYIAKKSVCPSWRSYHNNLNYDLVGLDLDPVNSTKYSLSVNTFIPDLIDINLDLFYKFNDKQIRVKRKWYEYEEPTLRLFNGDKSEIKGMEVGLITKRMNNIKIYTNYNFSQVQGYGSDAYDLYKNYLNYYPIRFVPLDFQITHQGIIQLDFRTFKNAKLILLRDIGINLSYQFKSGHPFTLLKNVNSDSSLYAKGVKYMVDRRPYRVAENFKSRTTPWASAFDLNIEKTFTLFESLQAKFWIQVFNLLNTKNEINVYQSTGSPADDGFITDKEFIEEYVNTHGQDDVDMYNAINIKNGQSYWEYLGKQLYGHPRQILFGLEIIF